MFPPADHASTDRSTLANHFSRDSMRYIGYTGKNYGILFIICSLHTRVWAGSSKASILHLPMAGLPFSTARTTICIGLDEASRSKRGAQIQRLTAHQASDGIARDCIECVAQGGNCCGHPLNIGVVRRWMVGDVTGPQGVVYNGPPPSPPAATPGECPPSLQHSHVFLLLHLVANIAVVLMYCHALQYYCLI